MSKIFLSLLSSYFLMNLTCYAQNLLKQGEIKSILSAITQKQISEAKETIYIQFDKPYYIAGDTLWYKAYVFDAASFTTTKKSGLLYISLSNEKEEQIRFFILPLVAGLGWGDIPLNENDLPAGSYRLRAYTNWMRNYGEQAVFTYNFYISGRTESNWLVNAVTHVKNGADSATLNLSLRKLNQEPIRLQSLRLAVSSGDKTLATSRVQTGVDGALGINIPLPSKANGKQLVLTVTNDTKEENKQQLIMPLAVNRPENADVQFMPEGGNLIAGISSMIGFKAIAEDGSSIPVTGEILDKGNNLITTFKTQYNGMGSFQLKPQLNEHYTAKVRIGSITNTYLLPAVKATGTVLSITNLNDTSALTVTIKSTEPEQQYYLVGQSRGLACFGSTIHLKSNEKQLRITKDAFPTGVARITLLNENHQPVNERLLYIDHHDQLHISITNNKQIYGKRDSVGLQLTITNEENKPIIVNLSMAVTDDGQIKTDSNSKSNMFAKLLLNSGIRGDIETPNHYLQQTPAAWIDLDLLLLVQGWVVYDWTGVFSPVKSPKFKAEPQFEINGKITNVFGKPLAGTKVSLLGNKPLIVKDTLTNDKGLFTFRDFPHIDSPVFKIEALNRRGKEFNVGIQVDKAEPPVFTPISRITMPWNANIDTLMVKNSGYAVLTDNEKQAMLTQGGHILKEVKIKAQKIVKGSKNLNSLGNADQVLDDKDLLKAGKMTLLEILRKQVKGFSYDGSSFFIYNQTLNFIFDGIDANSNDTLTFADKMSLLNYYTAEDLTGLEVMYNMKYSAMYNARYKPGVLISYIKSGTANPAYVEITTRGKTGPVLSTIPGMYLYKSIPFEWPRKFFYSPRYSMKKNLTTVTDRRSTLFWAPNIFTGADGKAAISFYTSDMPGTYTITIEGTDMSGGIGSMEKKLLVE